MIDKATLIAVLLLVLCGCSTAGTLGNECTDTGTCMGSLVCTPRCTLQNSRYDTTTLLRYHICALPIEATAVAATCTARAAQGFRE